MFNGFSNPITSVSTQWNGKSSATYGTFSNQIDARYFKVSALQDEVLECVTWDALNNIAGTQITYVAKPGAIVAAGVAVPAYKAGDIIVAMRLQNPIKLTLDDDSTWEALWCDLNLDARQASGGSFAATWAVLRNVTPLSGLDVGGLGALAEGSLVLLVNQDDQSQQGLWSVQTGAWVRQIVPIGSLITVISGSAPYHAADSGEGTF